MFVKNDERLKYRSIQFNSTLSAQSEADLSGSCMGVCPLHPCEPSVIRSEPDCNIFIIGVDFQLQKLLLKKRDRCEIEDSAGREGRGLAGTTQDHRGCTTIYYTFWLLL